MKPEDIRKKMEEDSTFTASLEACENWPNHAYQFRPHGLKDALFLLADIGNGKDIPDEMILRKACAVVYADHLRLEHAFYYSQLAKHPRMNPPPPIRPTPKRFQQDPPRRPDPKRRILLG